MLVVWIRETETNRSVQKFSFPGVHHSLIPLRKQCSWSPECDNEFAYSRCVRAENDMEINFEELIGANNRHQNFAQLLLLLSNRFRKHKSGSTNKTLSMDNEDHPPPAPALSPSPTTTHIHFSRGLLRFILYLCERKCSNSHPHLTQGVS